LKRYYKQVQLTPHNEYDFSKARIFDTRAASSRPTSALASPLQPREHRVVYRNKGNALIKVWVLTEKEIPRLSQMIKKSIARFFSSFFFRKTGPRG
jgi:hypothetical protein